MPVILKNNASSTLATAITASDTAIVVADGSQFPALSAGEYFYATLVSPAGTLEIVKVTARVSNSLTVVRAQDGSSAASFQVGALVDMRVNAASVSELRDEASEISIADAGGYYTATDVEGALQELAQDTLSRVNVAALLADTALSYSNVTVGDSIRTREEGFAYEVAASSATDHHVTTAGGVKLYVVPVIGGNGQCFTVRQFGGQEDTDITTVLQATINAALYNELRGGDNYLQDVLVDLNKATISSTIYVGYGVSTADGGTGRRTIDVIGLGDMYTGDADVHKGTALTYTATSGPAFAFQGGRKPRFRGFFIEGVANEALFGLRTDPSTGISSELTMLRRSNFDIREWDKALYSAGVVPNRRYNPYAALALDPRSGSRPADVNISSVTAGSPAVITTASAHDLLDQGRAEAVLITGLGAVGVADGEYYAIQVSTTQAELYNLDWSATSASGTATGVLGRSYPAAPPYPPQEGTPDPDTGKDRTSGWLVEDCVIRGFEFGSVLNPGTQGSNGDFCEFRHVEVFYTKFAHSVSHPNARMNNYHRCNFFGGFAYLTSGRTGVAIGNANARVEGMGGGYFIKWFETTSSTRFGVTTFDMCHPEVVGMLGTFLAGGSAAQPIVFQNNMMKFKHEWSNPPALVDNFGGDPVPLTFIGCDLRGDKWLSIMSESVNLVGTRVDRTDRPTKSYRCMAVNNGLVVARRPYIDMGTWTAARFNIDTTVFTSTPQYGPGLVGTDRTTCIPVHTRQVSAAGTNEGAGHSVNVPPMSFVIGAPSRSFGLSPITNQTITFTFTPVYTEARMRHAGLNPGNLIVDTFGNGTVMSIRSVDYVTREINCTLETNWWDNGTDPAELFDQTWDWTTGTWTLYRCDQFTPPRGLVGTFTSGSNVITDVYSTGRSVTNVVDFGLAVGDWLSARYLPGGVYGDADTSITAIDTGARTITLTDNAARSMANVPLDFWFRTLANEAAV